MSLFYCPFFSSSFSMLVSPSFSLWLFVFRLSSMKHSMLCFSLIWKLELSWLPLCRLSLASMWLCCCLIPIITCIPSSMQSLFSDHLTANRTSKAKIVMKPLPFTSSGPFPQENGNFWTTASTLLLVVFSKYHQSQWLLQDMICFLVSFCLILFLHVLWSFIF